MDRQLPCGYIYCVVPSLIKVGKKNINNEYKDGKCIVKVGKSKMSNFHYRMRSYGNNHIVLGIHFSPMFDSMETWLIENFKREYGEPVYGAEYFLANPSRAFTIFTKFIANRPEEDLKIESTIDYGWLLSTKRRVKIINANGEVHPEQKIGWLQSTYKLIGNIAAKVGLMDISKSDQPNKKDAQLNKKDAQLNKKDAQPADGKKDEDDLLQFVMDLPEGDI